MSLLEDVLNTQSLGAKVITGLAITAVIVASVVAFARHFENLGYQKKVGEETAQLIKDLAQAKAKSKTLQEQKDKAEYELLKNKRALANIAAGNTVLVNGLRQQLATFNSGLSNDTRQTLENRIQTLSTVLEDCTGRYTEVANHADQLELDLEMLEQAWPKN